MSANSRYWTIKEAKEYAANIGISLSSPTIAAWCITFNLGHPIGNVKGRAHKWCVDRIKFSNFLIKECIPDETTIPNRK